MAKPLFDTTATHHANLAELCPIVGGAIVSKPLIDTGRLKQILFSLDAEQEISKHRAPYVATVHVLSGRLRFGVGDDSRKDGSREMAPGDWLVMPPNEPHDLTALEPTLFLLTLVKE